MGPDRHKLHFPRDGCCPPPQGGIFCLLLFCRSLVELEPALVVDEDVRLEGSARSSWGLLVLVG